jgi:hypothetical protein
MMLHNKSTYQKVSNIFHHASLITIINLLCKALQIYYLPHATTLHTIIENISNAAFLITTIIAVMLTIKFFLKDYKTFTRKHKVIALTIMICMAMFILWIVTTNKLLKFYIFALGDNQNPKIIYLLLFVICMLLIESYYAHQDHTKINEASLIKTIRNSFKLVIYKYIIIAISYAGLLRMAELHNFAANSVPIIETTSRWFGWALSLMLIIIWTVYLAYYLSNLFYHHDNKK